MEESIDYRLHVPFRGEGNACQETRSVSRWGGWKQACINGHQFGVEENNDYIGVVYQLGVKGMCAMRSISL